MSLNFNNTGILILIPLAIAFIGFIYYKYAKKNQRQRLFAILRTITAVLIILSISGISLIRTAKESTTIFVSDLSNSTQNRQAELEDFIQKALRTKSELDKTGIIAFGADSFTENEPSSSIIFNSFQTKINPEFTNISAALLHASSIFPSNSKKRIVLLTDGKENVGDMEKQLRILQQNKTIVDIFSVEEKTVEEVQLTKLIIPEKAGKNELVDIAVHLDSNVKTEAELLLYSGTQLKYKESISLDKGNNKFVFTDTVTGNGFLTYKVEIIPKKDTYIENNYLSGFIAVNDEPAILLIQDEDKQGEQIIKILKDQANIEVRAPEEAPQTAEGLIKYDGFILADISYEKLHQEFIENLSQQVKNQGKGLLVTGGDSSYGPGGYFQTRLEEMLPVKMDVKPKEEKPNLGLVLVIDKSGSMQEGQYGVSKLDLAKEAAIRSTEVLEPKDQLGVIAFDSDVKWLINMQKAENKEKLQNQIATLVPGGGTTIRPSLEAAVDTLVNADTKLKHIILLTDGQAETTGYEPALDKIKRNKITLSTVAVGTGADRSLLKTLAEAGDGRYYVTDEFSDIPSIFTKEAFMAGKKYLNTITFTPKLVNWSQILKKLDTVPQLNGYVATTIKPNSKLLLSGPEEDPILATGQYGLGRTVAWTSDAKGIWTGEWLKWQEGTQFWKNLVSWMVQQDIDKKYIAEAAYSEGKGIITLKSTVKEENPSASVAGIIIAPDGKEKKLELEAVSPGTYKGSFVPEGQGVYMINLSAGDKEAQEKIVTGINVGYSPEYDYFSIKKTEPQRIADITGGRVLKKPEEVFKSKLIDIKGSTDISNILLLLALIVFLIEIALRKTNYRLLSDSFLEKYSIKSIMERIQNIRARAFAEKNNRPVADKKAQQEKTNEQNKAEQPINNMQANTNTAQSLKAEAPSKNNGGAKTSDTNSKNKEAIKTNKKQEKTQADTSHLDTLLAKKRKRDQ